MRVPRSLVLGPGAAFHLWWRGHNRENVLESASEKRRYLDCLAKARASIAPSHSAWLEIFSFCLMSNHAHLSGLVSAEAPSLQPLSRLFQVAHSIFGRWYNRLKGRSGKVAEERFKTRRVQDDDALRTVMFYGDANPVKAGLVKHPKDYLWSSYSFFAFGRKVPGHELITIPDWYLELGSSRQHRQRQYRRLVDDYLRHHHLLKDAPDAPPRGYFIGTRRFVAVMSESLRAALQRMRRGEGPRGSPEIPK